MSTFVLLHGAWHGAWCWYKVIPRLRALGHRALASDSAGLGLDQTPLTDVTLEGWVEDLAAELDALDERAILVAHSRGGIIASQVAERRPTRVAGVVYVSALLLRDGESALAALQEDATSQMLPNLVMAPDGSSATIRPEAIRDVFYGRTPEEDIALAECLLTPEPTLPTGTPLSLTDAGFGSVPRFYIECTDDNAVPIGLQRRMQSYWPCRGVGSLDADHSPFFSAPRHLTDCIVGLTS
jgi:pimeloyl-ACP methyl ester carboxylesterase